MTLEEQQQQPEIAKPPLWRLTVDRFLAAGYKADDVIRHAWFYESLGLEEPSSTTPNAIAEKTNWQYCAGMERVRRLLLEDHQIFLVNVRGVGYRWVPPGEQTGVAMQEWEQDLKGATREAGRRFLNVAHEALTDAQRKENSEALAKLASFKVMRRRLLTNGQVKALEDKR